MDWPNDADGDVLGRMKSRGFDFSKSYLVDFNVDFSTWPPSDAAMEILRREYPSTKVYEPSDGGDGYVQFQVYEKVSYGLVTKIQAYVSDLMRPYGGVCDSWGVLH